MSTKYFAILDILPPVFSAKKSLHRALFLYIAVFAPSPQETVFFVFSLSAAPYSHPEYIVINVIHAKTGTLNISWDHLPPL